MAPLPLESIKIPKKISNLSSNKQQTLDFCGINIPKYNKEDNFPTLPLSFSKLKIISWNVNGIRAVMKRNELQYLLEKESPDILCLNETKIDDITLRNEKINTVFNKTYLTYWNCSKEKKGYSGVAIFSKYKPLKVTNDINISKHDKEGRVLTVEYEAFIIVTVYVPNSGRERLEYRTLEWDIDFQAYVKSLGNNGKKKVIVAGDLNVCHKEIDIYDPKLVIPGFFNEERENMTKWLNDGYVDSFRWKNGDEIVAFSQFESLNHKQNCKGLRLDYFLLTSNAIKNIDSSEILTRYEGSDHVPILLQLTIKDETNTKDNDKDKDKDNDNNEETTKDNTQCLQSDIETKIEKDQ